MPPKKKVVPVVAVVEAQDNENKSAVSVKKVHAKEPFQKRNPKWSYEDEVFWEENSVVMMLTGLFTRKTDDSAPPRRYRLIFHKAVGQDFASICSEYKDQDGNRSVSSFGTCKFGWKDCNRRDVEANPKARLIQQNDFVYEHSNQGNIFKSHSTPLVTIDPMNKLVALFCEGWIHGKMDHPTVRDNFRVFRPESFMKDETCLKLSELLRVSRKANLPDGSLKGPLAVVDIKEHALNEEDLYDVDMAFERFDLFKAHISQTQNTNHLDEFRIDAESNIKIAKKLSV